MRHISGAEALHRSNERQNGQLTRPNPERRQRVVEEARKDSIEHTGAAIYTTAEDLSSRLPAQGAVHVTVYYR